MLQTTRTSFLSGGVSCAAWVTHPDGDGPHPAVVLVHGFGATHEMRLSQYEQAFAAAGMVVLSFDFRYIGASEGAPRQFISIPRQLADVEAAIEFIRRDPKVDQDRIALWGTSMGSTHVFLTAARHPELGAAVVQCPVIDTSNAAKASGFAAMLKLAVPITRDLIRGALHLPRIYVPVVDEPGHTAIVSVPDAKNGWFGMVPAGAEFDNRVTAAVGMELIRLNAAKVAKNIQAPLLVCVSDHETLMDPRIAVRAAAAAPRGTAIRYPADHFEVYHAPLVAGIIEDQTTFLTTNLGLKETARA